MTMNWQSLLEPDIQNFIRENENADIAKLALKKPPHSNWDYPLILSQIKARQKAKTKIPAWLETDDIIFPPPDILEQASSAATALYKSRLTSGEKFIDLTGGTGVDSWGFLQNFTSSIIVEENKIAAKALQNNLPKLSNANIDVIATTAEEFIKTAPKADLIYIDPQRRDMARKGKFKFEECSPDILAILPALFEKSDTVMIKTSPMLDIAEGINALKNVEHVHIVEWKGDCKELIFILKKDASPSPQITAVNIDEQGYPKTSLNFTLAEEQGAKAEISAPLKYLFEPSPAFQKSGAFNTIGARFNLKKLHTHTHLYTGDTLVNDFPGRNFEIIDLYPVKSGMLPFKKANLTTRNFPMSTPDLQKKLKIKDGGTEYIFACTLFDNSKTLIHTRKAANPNN